MNEADLDHLLPEFRAAALLPDSERIVRVRSERWIDHPNRPRRPRRAAGDRRSAAAGPDVERAADGGARHGQDDDAQKVGAGQRSTWLDASTPQRLNCEP